ncbi:MAG: WD40 repeat domain-containing protein, partial [Moorea sp. SIO2B7]|nr:WD40 repeat domain-containing protein [Moorena sp. SIO2B7]
KLVDARLLVTDDHTVEIIHDALITEWTELGWWISGKRAFLFWRQRLDGSLREWQDKKKKGEEGDFLYGAALGEAEGYLNNDQYRVELRQDERNYIQTSVDRRDRQRRRTIFRLASFSIVTSILFLVAGIGWWSAFSGGKNYRILAINKSSETLLASNKQFDVLLDTIKTWNQTKDELGEINATTEMLVATTLMQSLDDIKERNRFEGYNQPFIRASFSSDGKKIAATNMEGTIKIWNLNGEEIATINQNKSGDISNTYSSTEDCPVNSVSFSPNNNIIAASDGDDIKLWDFNGKKLNSLQGKGKDVTATSISNDGKLIAAVSSDGKVNIWNQQGEELHTFQHSDNFFPLSNPISFSPDNKILASTDGEKNVILWNFPTETAKTLKHQWTVCSIDFNSNSSVLAVTEYLDRVNLWRTEDQKQNGFEEFGVISVIHSPEGIVSTNWDGSIKFWHLFNNEWRVKSSWKVHSAPVWNASFSPDEKMLISVSDDKTLKLWNIEGIKPPSFRPINGTLGDMSLSPDGQTIATVTHDDSIKLWYLNGTLRKKPFQKVSPFSKITFSPDGKYLVSSHRNLVQLWNIESGESNTIIKQELPRRRRKRNDFGRVSFSHNSETIAVGKEDGTIKLLTSDGTEIKTLQGGSKLVSYSPNGKIIASASSNNTVKLWSADGKELPSLVGSPYSITSLSFSPDSKILVAGNENGNILIWSITGKQLLHTLQGHTSAVSSLTFRPDGKIFASASGNGSNKDDGRIKFWSVDGIEIKTFKTNSSAVPSISFSPDGKMLVWTNQIEVIMWNLDLDYLLSKGCDWVRDYLQHNPNVKKKDKKLCDGIGTQK